MKLTYFLILILTIGSSIFSFGSKEEILDIKDKKVVALILDSPGLGDDSINDSCYLGLQKAAEEGFITLRVKTSNNIEESAELLTEFAEEKVNIIYLIGEINRDLLVDASKQYSDITFIGVDIFFQETELSNNLFGITFKEQDGGYLAGLVAGSMTYQYNNRHKYLNDINRVGIILGKNTPSIKRYELGFYAGVKKVNQPCEIISININDIDNPEKGFNAVAELKQKGVDIIFSLAGDGSNSGVFRAAEENEILVIAANKDNSSNSGIILTSVEKKISISTYLMTKGFIEGSYLSGSNIIFGLLEKAISLSPYYNYDKYIPKDLRVLIKDMTLKLTKSSDLIPDSIENIIFDIEKIPTIEE